MTERGYRNLTEEERREIDARPKEPIVECPKHGFPEICPCGWVNPRILKGRNHMTRDKIRLRFRPGNFPNGVWDSQVTKGHWEWKNGEIWVGDLGIITTLKGLEEHFSVPGNQNFPHRFVRECKGAST